MNWILEVYPEKKIGEVIECVCEENCPEGLELLSSDFSLGELLP